MTTVGYTTGVFDLFHVGHVNVLRRARAACDLLVVGVASDDFCETFKGVRPVVPLDERLEIVRACKYADEVVVEASPSKLDAWHARPFDVMFKGDDWRGTDKGRRLELDLASVGVAVQYFPYTVETSSTRLRAALDALVRG